MSHLFEARGDLRPNPKALAWAGLVRAVGPLTVLFACFAVWPARGQIVADGSLTDRVTRTLSGPAFAITPDLGRKVGGNLFHSFSDFNIRNGESATFSGPGDVRNILARTAARA